MGKKHAYVVLLAASPSIIPTLYMLVQCAIWCRAFCLELYDAILHAAALPCMLAFYTAVVDSTTVTMIVSFIFPPIELFYYNRTRTGSIRPVVVESGAMGTY